MRTSLIIPCAGDERLAATVESALSDTGVAEVIVVDDQMRDRPRFVQEKVIVRRTARQLGVGGARNWGARFATAAVLAWADAHVLFPDAALSALAEVAESEQAIVCPTSWNWAGRKPVSSGGLLSMDNVLCRQRMIGAPRRTDTRPVPVRCLLGGCYVMPRSVWQRMGPWLDTEAQWGFSEEAYTLLARFLGVPVLCAPWVKTQHYYWNGRSKPYDQQPAVKELNAARALFCLLDDAHWKWARRELGRLVCEERLRAIESEPANINRRADIAAAKVMSDDDVIEWIRGSSPELTPRQTTVDLGQRRRTMAGEKERVTVVLLNWQRRENMNEILDAVLWQRGVDPIIWVWNNSGERLDDPRIDLEIVASQNCGCRSRHVLAGMAETECVITHDDDIRPGDRNVFKDTLIAVHAAPEHAVIGAFGVELVPGRTYRNGRHYNPRHGRRQVDIVKNRFMAYRTSALRRVGLTYWRDLLDEDVALCGILAGGRLGQHVLPGIYERRLIELDTRDVATEKQPGHYERRDAEAQGWFGAALSRKGRGDTMPEPQAKEVDLDANLTPSQRPVPLRLNIGCGPKHCNGMWNVDRIEPADELIDLTQPWPIADNAAEEIRADNVLEHFQGDTDLVHVLNEAHRVLRPGGRMTILVPSAEKLFHAAIGDPGHKTYFLPRLFEYWTEGQKRRTPWGKRYGFRAWRQISLEHGTNIVVVQEPIKERELANSPAGRRETEQATGVLAKADTYGVEDVAAVMCTWRRPKQAARTVESLRALGIGEIHVIGDGGATRPDGVQDKEWHGHEDRRGPGRRWEYGVETGLPLVMFVDDDAQVEPAGLAALLSGVNGSEDCLYALCGKLGADHHTDPSRIVYSHECGRPTEVDIVLPGWGAMIHRDALRRVSIRAQDVFVEQSEAASWADNRAISIAAALELKQHPIVVPTAGLGYHAEPNDERALCRDPQVKEAHNRIVQAGMQAGWTPIGGPVWEWPRVTLLTPTYGRFEKLRRMMACVQAQDYPGDYMWYVVNDAPREIVCDAPGVTVENVQPGRFATIGDKRRYLLERAPTEIVGWIDDDDMIRSWYLRRAVWELMSSGAGCVRMRRALLAEGELPYWRVVRMIQSNLEGTMVFRKSEALRYDIPSMNSGQLLPMLESFKRDGRLHDYDGNPALIVCMGDRTGHLSGSLARTKKDWEALNQDFGNGAPLTPVDLTPYWTALDQATPSEGGAAEPVRADGYAEPTRAPAVHTNRVHTAACIPAWNDDYSLLLSVQAIAPHVDEVVVLDDASADRTGDVLNTLSRTYRNVRWSRGEQQRTWWDARNELLALTEATKLLFIDADDIFDERRVEELRGVLHGVAPYVQLGLCELRGDFKHGTGRGYRHPHHDPCHVYIDRTRVTKIRWTHRDTFSHPVVENVSPAKSDGVLFFHANRVKSDVRMVQRHWLRDWMRAGACGPFDAYFAARRREEDIDNDALHRLANELIFQCSADPFRRLPAELVLPDVCRRHDRFEVIYDGDIPVDRVDHGFRIE